MTVGVLPAPETDAIPDAPLADVIIGPVAGLAIIAGLGVLVLTPLRLRQRLPG